MYYHSNSTHCLYAGTSPCSQQLCDSPQKCLQRTGTTFSLTLPTAPRIRGAQPWRKEAQLGMEGPEQHRHSFWGTSKYLITASCPS